MELGKILVGSIQTYVTLALFGVVLHGEIALAGSTPSASAKVESLDQLYEKAKKEGHVVMYMATSAKTEVVVFPAFEKRFPGIKVNHVNATADQLVTRAVAEARGGRIVADVISGTQNYITQLREQDMLLDIALPEGASYPAVLKGSYWVATDTEFFIAAWNSSRLKKEDEPKTFEDFADPKWAKRLIAEPRDFQLLLGLAKYKYGSNEKAFALFKKIAANKLEFFKGHSQLAEFLAAGQTDVCMTCYAHHIPPMAKKGAPLQIMLGEGAGRIGGTGTIVRGAPHPNAAPRKVPGLGHSESAYRNDIPRRSKNRSPPYRRTAECRDDFCRARRRRATDCRASACGQKVRAS